MRVQHDKWDITWTTDKIRDQERYDSIGNLGEGQEIPLEIPRKGLQAINVDIS